MSSTPTSPLVDPALLQHCRRSAQAGFPFRVRTPAVAATLLLQGLATRDASDPLLLTGLPLAHTWAPPARDPLPLRPTAASAAPDRPRRCASGHHLAPVAAEVTGVRQRGAADVLGGERVELCARCASMLADAGYFTARPA